MVLGIGMFGFITATVTSYLMTSDERADNPVAQLRQLGRLRDDGVITEEEFQAKKAILLDRIA
jgi:hypothetical protein